MINPFFYNPFLRVTEPWLRQLVLSGKRSLYCSVFDWPGVPAGKGFMLSAYNTLEEAHQHEWQLSDKEGKCLNLTNVHELKKVNDLLQTDSGLHVFFNGTLDKLNEKRLRICYAKQVHGYIKSIRMPNYDGYIVRVYVEQGRVKGEITSGEHRHTNLLYKMIN